MSPAKFDRCVKKVRKDLKKKKKKGNAFAICKSSIKKKKRKKKVFKIRFPY